MSKRAIFQDMINMLSGKSDMTKAQTEKFCRQFFTTIREALLREDYVKVKGLGIFKLINVSGRESVDVNTGQRIEISAHNRIVFTPDKTMASRINRPFENFETVVLDEADEGNEPATNVPDVKSDEQGETDMEEERSQSIYLGDDDEAEDGGQVNLMPEQEHADVPVQDEPEQDNASDLQTDTEEEPQEEYEIDSGTPVWKKILCAALLLLLLGAAYFVGYYRLLGNTDILPSAPKSVGKEMPKQTAPVPAVKDTMALPDDSIAETKETDWKAEAAKYEQMPNADYLIVGELETHEMGVGESIIRLSQKLYGSKDMAKYVIFHNHISNPDVIHVGKKVVFPKLHKSEDTEN